MKNSSYIYIAPAGDRTHDLPHTVASNMVKVSHALNQSATEVREDEEGFMWLITTKDWTLRSVDDLGDSYQDQNKIRRKVVAGASV